MLYPHIRVGMTASRSIRISLGVTIEIFGYTLKKYLVKIGSHTTIHRLKKSDKNWPVLDEIDSENGYILTIFQFRSVHS